MEYEFYLEQKYLRERQVEARILTAAQADTMDKQQTVLAEMERYRAQLHQLVDNRLDAFILRVTCDDLSEYIQDETVRAIPLVSAPARCKGTKPVAVILPDGSMAETATWKKVAAAISKGQVCGALEINLCRGDGTEKAMLYPLSPAEKKTLAGKMEAFCRKQTGLSLKDYCAQIQAENIHVMAGAATPKKSSRTRNADRGAR